MNTDWRIKVGVWFTVLSFLAIMPVSMAGETVSRSVTVSEDAAEGPPIATAFNEGDGLDWTGTGQTKVLKITLNAPSDKEIKCGDPVQEGIFWECPDSDNWSSSHTYTSQEITSLNNYLTLFKGELTEDQNGGGGGGAGDLPTWSAGVVHADIQADADNDSDSFQRPPAAGGTEREEEEVAEQSNPGLIVSRNSGRNEGDYNVDEDYENPGINTQDPDLVRAKVVLKMPGEVEPDDDPENNPGGKVKISYTSSNLKVYTDSDLQNPIPDGVAQDYDAFGEETTLWIEGIDSTTVGGGQIKVTLIPQNHEEVSRDKVKMTVMEIKSVSWAEDLEANPHEDAPEGAEGVRVFAGKENLSSPEPNDSRIIDFNIQPNLHNVPIYIKSFDIDDPSSDNAIDKNGKDGDDNFGSPNTGTIQGDNPVTTNSGDAIGYFQTTMQPGDNFRIVASAMNDSTGSYSNDLIAGSDPASDPVTQTLTVWRKLHVDRDSMEGAGLSQINFQPGTVESFTRDGDIAILTVSDFDQPSFEGDHFFLCYDAFTDNPRPQGKILLTSSSGTTVTRIVVDNECNVNGTEKEQITIKYWDGLEDYVPGNFRLYDDDSWPTHYQEYNPVQLPIWPPITVLDNAMKQAYVDVAPYDYDQDSPYHRNVENDDVLQVGGVNLENKGSNEWWVAHITSAFQGPRDHDQDPEVEGGEILGANGETNYPGNGEGALIYYETIRDFADLPSDTYTWNDRVMQNVAHEVGHQFTLIHPDGAYNGETWLMAGADEMGIYRNRDNVVFSPPNIRKIRSVDYTIQDP